MKLYWENLYSNYIGGKVKKKYKFYNKLINKNTALSNYIKSVLY